MAPEIFQLFPDACVGVVVATGLSNEGVDEMTRADLRQEGERARAVYAEWPLEADPFLAAWRGAFQRLGVDPERYSSSVEALLRRTVRDEEVPAISKAVDLANLVSLRHKVPVGAHDLDRLRGDFQVRLSRPGDVFTPLGHHQTEPVSAGEVVYADDDEVRTRRWVWRLGDRGKVTPNSRNVFFPIDGFKGRTEAQVRQATADLTNLLAHRLGAQVVQGFVDADAPAFDVPAWIPSEVDPVERLLTRRVVEVFPSREELEEVLRSGKQLRVYFGVDPTSPIIHVGHAVQLRKLREFQDLGHKVILLIGDFTGRIGDPSDKSAARVQLTREQVLENTRTYTEQAARILDFQSATNPVDVRFNREWWDTKTARDVIELAAYFTVQQMIQRDMFQIRLAENKPIGLHEFLYPILQGYDSVAMNVDAELGGTDQTFNMLAGRTLVKGMLGKEKYVLTGPLLEGLDGRKMSKSYGNVVGVSDPPYDMYGKVMSLKDELTLRYFELLTDVPDSDLERMSQELTAGTANPMVLKKRLAADLVTRFHGPEATQQAAERFAREVQRRELPAEIPTVVLPHGGHWPLVDLLVTCKLAAGRNDAKRLIEGGSAEANGQKVTDPRATVEVYDGMVLRGRRRQFVRLQVTEES